MAASRNNCQPQRKAASVTASSRKQGRQGQFVKLLVSIIRCSGTSSNLTGLHFEIYLTWSAPKQPSQEKPGLPVVCSESSPWSQAHARRAHDRLQTWQQRLGIMKFVASNAEGNEAFYKRIAKVIKMNWKPHKWVESLKRIRGILCKKQLLTNSGL